jgi:hypothetical protein
MNPSRIWLVVKARKRTKHDKRVNQLEQRTDITKVKEMERDVRLEPSSFMYAINQKTPNKPFTCFAI